MNPLKENRSARNMVVARMAESADGKAWLPSYMNHNRCIPFVRSERDKRLDAQFDNGPVRVLVKDGKAVDAVLRAVEGK
jgi:hypothetical protein